MPVLAATSARRPLDLPPPYRVLTLRETGDAFEHACRIAAEEGAGSFVRVGRFDLVEFALVLEPEDPLARARRAFFACMAALGDAIGAVCPPQKQVAFDWPDTIRLDGARIGGGRLGWPADCAEDEVAAWLVFSACLIVAKMGAGDPGLTPQSTSLAEERFDESADALLESFGRHLMLAFDTWSDDGFEPIAASYLSRLSMPAATRLEANGDLSLAAAGESGVRLPLVPALKEPAWLDPATGGPRL